MRRITRFYSIIYDDSLVNSIVAKTCNLSPRTRRVLYVDKERESEKLPFAESFRSNADIWTYLETFFVEII